MKPLKKRLLFFAVIFLSAAQWLSCGDSDPFGNGRSNIMGESYSLDRPLVTKEQTTTDGQSTATMDQGQKVTGTQSPMLGSLPYYCNPLRYPGNIINSAGNCRPFLNNLGSLIPSTSQFPLLQNLGLGESYGQAATGGAGLGFPGGLNAGFAGGLDGGFSGGLDGSFAGGLDGGFSGGLDGGFAGGFDGGFAGDGGPGIDSPPLFYNFMDGHTFYDGGDINRREIALSGNNVLPREKHHKKKRKRCCRPDDDENNDDDEGEKVIKKHR